MRADICAAVTLDTVLRLPYRDVNGDSTFLVCGGTGGSCTVNISGKCGYRQSISFLSVYFGLDIVYEINNILSSAFCVSHEQAFVFCGLPALRNFNFVNLLSARHR